MSGQLQRRSPVPVRDNINLVCLAAAVVDFVEKDDVAVVCVLSFLSRLCDFSSYLTGEHPEDPRALQCANPLSTRLLWGWQYAGSGKRLTLPMISAAFVNLVDAHPELHLLSSYVNICCPFVTLHLYQTLAKFRGFYERHRNCMDSEHAVLLLTTSSNYPGVGG